MCFGGDNSSRAIAAAEQKRQDLISQGLSQVNQAFAGFNPAFYQKAQESYLNAALPQVGEQYRQASHQLGYNLANRGLLRSSAAQNLQGSLQRALATNQTNVANQAIQATQGLQQQIEGQKRNIIGQLEASADPQAATQQALASAQSFQSPSLVQPVGDLFRNWSNIYLARAVGQTYNPQTQQSSSRVQLPQNYTVGR